MVDQTIFSNYEAGKRHEGQIWWMWWILQLFTIQLGHFGRQNLTNLHTRIMLMIESFFRTWAFFFDFDTQLVSSRKSWYRVHSKGQWLSLWRPISPFNLRNPLLRLLICFWSIVVDQCFINSNVSTKKLPRIRRMIQKPHSRPHAYSHCSPLANVANISNSQIPNFFTNKFSFNIRVSALSKSLWLEYSAHFNSSVMQNHFPRFFQSIQDKTLPLVVLIDVH